MCFIEDKFNDDEIMKTVKLELYKYGDDWDTYLENGHISGKFLDMQLINDLKTLAADQRLNNNLQCLLQEPRILERSSIKLRVLLHRILLARGRLRILRMCNTSNLFVLTHIMSYMVDPETRTTFADTVDEEISFESLVTCVSQQFRF